METDTRYQGEPYIHTKDCPDGTFIASTILFQEKTDTKKAGWLVYIHHRYESLSDDPSIYFSSGIVKKYGVFKNENHAKKNAISLVNGFDLSILQNMYYYMNNEEVKAWK